MTAPLWNHQLLSAPHRAQDKASRVRRMFDAIAPRYQLVNSLFSGGRDACWRRRAVDLANVRVSDSVLDIACGTGDFGRAFALAKPKRIIACDFAHQMLLRAAFNNHRQTAHFVEADALTLPFPPASFSIVSCAFGVRNFADLNAGLREMRRVLSNGGRAVILEFTRPANRLFRLFYELYTNRVMPIGASLISGDHTGAYRYLPRSVVSFLDAEQMVERLRSAGFATVSATPLTFGAVTVYLAHVE